MIKLNHLIRKELVYEGLIYTVNLGTTSDMLENWSGSGEKFKIRTTPSKIFLNFTKNLDETEFNHLLRLINNLGWFISAVLISHSSMNWEKFNYTKFIQTEMNTPWVSFQLEAKFDVELNIHDYDILYHVSPSINKNKILRIGLVPKTKSKKMSHPERIYLTDNENDSNVIAFQFHKNNPDIALSVSKINFKGVCRDNPSIRLFDDPNFKGGFFTLSNIPPKFISWDGEMEI
jgi:hypothetical protein